MALVDCSVCGNKISDRAIACPKCGGTTSVEEPDASEAVYDPSFIPDPGPDAPPKGGSRWSLRKPRNRWIVGGAGSLIAIACIAGFLLFNSQKDVPNSEAESTGAPEPTAAGMLLNEIELEAIISGQLPEGFASEVTCPEDIPMQEGFSFQCTGVLRPSALPGVEIDFTAEVDQTSAEGAVRYEINVDSEDIEALKKSKGTGDEKEQIQELIERLDN